MDYTQLKADITAEGIDWNLTDQAIADAMNALTVPGTQSVQVTYRDLANTLTPAEARGLISGLKTAAASDVLVEVAFEALNDYAETGGIDLNDANTQTVINELVVAGHVDATVASNLVAMTQVDLPKYPNITWKHVQRARTR